MRKLGFLVVSCFLIFTLTACSQKQEEKPNRMMEYFNKKVMSDTPPNVEVLDTLHTKNLSSLCADGDNLYVLDGERNRVIKLSKEGNVLLEIGSVGNLEGKLLKPSAMVVTDDCIVVAEEGNRRLQGFGKNGDSQFIIPLPILPEDYAFIKSIAPTQSGYLVCIIFPYDNDKSTVWHVTNDGIATEIMKQTNGCFVWDDSGIYLLEKLVYSGIDNINYQTGEGSAWKWQDARFVKMEALPFGYVTSGAVKVNDYWYTANESFYSVDHFNEAGQYKSTLLMLETVAEGIINQGSPLSIAGDGVHIYVLIASDGKILKITPAQ